jgi:regulator of RNase E activity RraB
MTKGNSMDEIWYEGWMKYFEECGLADEQADEQYDGRDA